MNSPRAVVIAEFVERMGLVAQADGLPRIAGRILGLLIIEQGPFGFNDMAERLLVSRGSISTNTRLLEQLGLIERVTRSGERQDLFQLAPDPYTRLLHGAIDRMRKAHDVVSRTRARLPEDDTIAHGRLDALGGFYRQAIEGVSGIVRSFDRKH